MARHSVHIVFLNKNFCYLSNWYILVHLIINIVWHMVYKNTTVTVQLFNYLSMTNCFVTADSEKNKMWY